MASVGFIGPNATALALQEHGAQAGTASALVGLGQFVTGALAAPLTGLVGGPGALPLAVVMAGFALAALVGEPAHPAAPPGPRCHVLTAPPDRHGRSCTECLVVA